MANKKQDNADLDVTENRDFYPEDAQERNAQMARELAEENTKKDQANAEADAARAADDEGSDVIPAQPKTTAMENPEQVAINEAPASDDAKKK